MNGFTSLALAEQHRSDLLATAERVRAARGVRAACSPRLRFRVRRPADAARVPGLATGAVPSAPAIAPACR
jgi:hypothetical protein